MNRTPVSTLEKYKVLSVLDLGLKIERTAERYHVSVRSIYRWKKKFDGTKESLANLSHRPHSKHPSSMSEDETSKIDLLVRRNYGIGLNELYGKLRHDYGFSRNPSTLYRYLKKTGYFLDLSKNRKRYVPKKYDTPEKIGEKWQLDVKYVPRSCKASSLAFDHKFYQYTVIDEATRERFIYFYEEQDSLNSIDFMKRAITYFRYRPKIVQTDNGHEFTFSSIVKKKITHPFNEFLTGQGIIQQVIRPRTPRHNGKVERSHRNDNERFYKTLKFYSYQDLLDQGKKYLKRSNNIPTIVLNWMTPLEKRRELLLLQHGVVEN